MYSTKHYTQELMNELDLWEHKYNVEWNTRMCTADLYVEECAIGMDCASV